MTTVLHANDEVHCLHCHCWHAVQHENVGRTPAENLYRYVTCGGKVFYVGTVGTPCRWPTRRAPIWTLTKDTRRLECCLRSEGELGWAVQLYRNGLQYASRRFVLHAEAVANAEEVRGDCEREGWNTLAP
jgi:hypothetical protein